MAGALMVGGKQDIVTMQYYYNDYCKGFPAISGQGQKKVGFPAISLKGNGHYW